MIVEPYIVNVSRGYYKIARVIFDHNRKKMQYLNIDNVNGSFWEEGYSAGTLIRGIGKAKWILDGIKGDDDEIA